MKTSMPERDFSHAQRAQQVPALARIQADNTGKERITIRLDADVMGAFKASGRGWQTRINAILREAMEAGRI